MRDAGCGVKYLLKQNKWPNLTSVTKPKLYMPQYFQYGSLEMEHLKRADKKLAPIIEQIGIIKRPIMPDLFTALVHSIVSQQISNKARNTIWKRIEDKLEEITPYSVQRLPLEELQQCGISFRKAEYIKSAAETIASGGLDLNALHSLTDQEVCEKLTQLKGIGTWTAEMLMLFSMQRPNILSFGDLAIQKGLRMVYHHRKIDKVIFNKYWKRYTPYASVASLYLWEVAGGAIEGMKDYAPIQKKP